MIKLFSSRSKKVRVGFSLSELLLTVGIIGVLAAGAIAVLNPITALKRSRDAVRLQDLNTLKSALVLATQNGVNFGRRCLNLSPCDSLDNSSVTNGAGYVDLDLTGYISQLPRDPHHSRSILVDLLDQSGPASYQFAHDSAGHFEIRARLEAKDNASRYADDGGDDAGYYEVGTKLDIL